jgi:hypothetical protein
MRFGKQVITSPSPAVWLNDFPTMCGAADRMTQGVARDTNILAGRFFAEDYPCQQHVLCMRAVIRSNFTFTATVQS